MPGGLSVSAWETRVLGQLGDHPNIASVLEHWEDDKASFMSSRYLSGGSLRDRIVRSKDTGKVLAVEGIVRIATEIAQGLSYIHGRRILYRDLQPRNVLFDERNTVHLVDFDTAVSLDDRNMSDMSYRPVIDYMAPELVDGGCADGRADLYSLGATIYEMAEGRPPFAGTRDEILAECRSDLRPPFERDDVPQALRDLVYGLLAPEREERPASAAEVIERLELIGLHAVHDNIERLLASDETTTLEFKASLRTPVGPIDPRNQRTQKEFARILQHEVLATLAAFFNTDGGALIIGVADDHTVVGIEVDYPNLHRKSSDGWRCTFDDLVSDHLGTEVMNSIDLQLEPWQGHTIAVIRCARREEPTWIGDELFARRTASTVKLSNREALAWWHERRGQISTR